MRKKPKKRNKKPDKTNQKILNRDLVGLRIDIICDFNKLLLSNVNKLKDILIFHNCPKPVQKELRLEDRVKQIIASQIIDPIWDKKKSRIIAFKWR